MLLLEKQFTTFEHYCSGELGFQAIHVETGKTLGFKAYDTFLMCSTFKIPMAICLLQKVESNEFHLTDLYSVTEYDLRPGSSPTLTQFSYDAPISMSLRNLLQLMLQESCNTSTDILLRLMGGPPAVMKFLQKAGIQNMRIDRYMLEMIADSEGVKDLPADHRITLSEYKVREKAVSQENVLKAELVFSKDNKDTATPFAMALLLERLFKHEFLTKDHTNLLLQIMRRCKRGPLRLMGLLPHGTSVAHKTGTFTSYTSDVGIITLPHHAGHVAIAAYIKYSKKGLTHDERVLAEVGRTVYDYFLM